MAPLKICIVSRCAWTFFNFRLGLARALASSPGVEVHAAGIGVAPYDSRISACGIPFEALPGEVHGSSPLQLFRFGAGLYRLYRRLHPEVVHHFTIKPVVFGTLAARIAGVPRIVNTISGLGKAFDTDGSATGIAARLLYRLSLRYSTHVFFQNEEDRALFVSLGLVAHGKTSVVAGSGVDLERFRPGNRGSWGPPDGIPVVLMMARLLRAKGVAEFAEAAALVRKSDPKAVFVLLGGRDFGNPDCVPETELKRWVDAGAIRWIDHVDDVRPVLERADLVVLPSYYREGIPRALLEAAAMGKAIVTTDNTGCREVVQPGENGLIVPARDSGALAGAIETLLRDAELRRRMGAQGRRRAEARFDERGIIESARAAYGL